MKKTHKKPLYFCDLCDFKTSNKKYFTRHSKTAKHINSVLIQQNSTEIIKILSIKILEKLLALLKKKGQK
jgi:hypothetical protein